MELLIIIGIGVVVIIITMIPLSFNKKYGESIGYKPFNVLNTIATILGWAGIIWSLLIFHEITSACDQANLGEPKEFLSCLEYGWTHGLDNKVVGFFSLVFISLILIIGVFISVHKKTNFFVALYIVTIAPIVGLLIVSWIYIFLIFLQTIIPKKHN